MTIDRRAALGNGLAAITVLATGSPGGATPPSPPRAIRTLHVKGLAIGEGRPKLIVSIAEQSPSAAVARARKLRANPAVDLIEYRIDHLADHADPARVAASVAEVAAACASKPLLMTFRTKAEGGMAAIAPDAYAALYTAALDRGGPALIDLEHALCTDPSVAALLRRAQAARLPVILSYHDFQGTPPVEAMVDKLRAMQALGADIPKIAVMPHDGGDTLRLLQATWEMHSRHADRPLLTMAMGGIGAVSRIAGETFGSALTFGAVGSASAPGQLRAAALRPALDLLAEAQQERAAS